MTILQRAQRVTRKYYYVDYLRVGAEQTRSGEVAEEWVYPDGHVERQPDYTGWQEKTVAALAAGYDAEGFTIVQLGDPYVMYENRYTVPALFECDFCQQQMYLTDPLLNTCYCERDYNMSGQLLAPRSQWGEETGETFSDIMLGSSLEDW